MKVETCNFFEYVPCPDGYYISGLRGIVKTSNLVLPDTYNGLKIVGIKDWAFCNVNLKKVTFNESIKYIGSYAFFRCTDLKNVTLNENLQRIGWYAFSRCNKLVECKIPAKVAKIGGGVFAGNTRMREILLDNDNKMYTSHEGVLYSYDMKTLLQYPAGKRNKYFNVPSSVNRIASYAFYKTKYIEEIDLPESIKKLGKCVFQFCSRLKKITLMNNIRELSGSAFQGSPRLVIYKQRSNYCNWAEDWNPDGNMVIEFD